METIPHWKRVWKAITCRSKNATPDVIEDALNLTKPYLLKGLSMYPPFTEDSFIKCSEKIELKDHVALSKFIHKLSVALDLDACVTWSIFCNYLMFEHYGKVDDMQMITSSESAGHTFIINVWQFYTLERTYLLRILQHMIENYGNIYHKFHRPYIKFLDDITIIKLRENIFDQFSHLIKEISEDNPNTTVEIHDIIDRNNSEVLQILLIILSTIKYDTFNIAEFLRLFTLFKEHMFTPSSQQQQILELSRSQILESIQSTEFAIFIASFNNFWHNQKEWYSSIEEIEKIIKEILPCEKNNVILLAWAALQTTLPNDLAKIIYEQHSHLYVSKALEKYVFVDLFKVYSNPIFKNSVAGKIAKDAIYKLFDVLCIKFEAQTVYTHEGSVPLFAQFLRTPNLALTWMNREGISAFLTNALTLFPFHFQTLSSFMESFIALEHETESVLQELYNLRTYTEIYNPPVMQRPNIRHGLLWETYKPLENDLIVFPRGAPSPVFEKCGETVVEIYGSWNYFILFKHFVNNFLDHVEKTHEYGDQAQKIVISGYKLILEILKVEPKLAWNDTDIKKTLQLAVCLLSISTKPQTKNLELMKICFEITIHVFKHDPADIVRALIAIEFLPKLANENICPKYFEKTYLLSDASLFRYIEEEFSHSKSCDLLILYIQFVNEAKKMSIYYAKLQVPACMFLFVKVFPVFIKQLFSENVKIRQVLVDLVMLIYNIMTIKPNSEDQADLNLYKCVMELFLHNKFCAKSLMKIFECGNNKLQLLLTTEMDWENGPLLLIVLAIKKALNCILLLLEYIKINGAGKNVLFEDLLYWYEAPNCSVLKVISSYVNHCFHPDIPKLACKILTAFVTISNRPLLHSLELDDYQLQSLFLERLRDSLDDQDMKVAVVTLVTACVNEQSSMTSGFFNMSPKGENSDVSILSFLAEYLKNIETNPNSLLIPIQGAIIDLFHVLWKNNKQHLLMNVTDPQSFWLALTTPLLKPNKVPLEILLQLLEIVVLELHYSKNNIHEKFNKEFRTLFELPKPFLNMWMDRLTEVSHDYTKLSDSSQLPLCIAFLTIWKNFVLSVKLLNPEYFERKWNRSFLVQRCLEGLLCYTEKPDQSEMITLWGELLLVFVDFPVMENLAVKENIFNCLTKILNNFSRFYEIVSASCRTVMLTVFTIVVTNFTEFLVTYPSFILPFLTPFESIFYFEYKVTFIHKSLKQNYYKNWVLVLRIIRTFLNFENVRDCELFFIHTRFVERTTEALGLCIIHPSSPKLAEVTAMTLVEFAESPWIRHFESLNLLVISEQLLPPKEFILQTNYFPNGHIPQHLKDWWTVYFHIMRLNCTLLRRRKGYVAKYILDFVYVHQTVLVDVILSATAVADVTNLNLVNEALRFIYSVLEYKQEWTLCDSTSYFRIMATIKEVLNAAIGVILRPKSLIFIPNNPQSAKMEVETIIPNHCLITVMNSYLDIITWSCKCFTRCNPPLNNLLNVYRPTNFKVFVENDFRVPIVVEENTQILTYGSLLCALHFITKALNQIFFQEKERSSESTPRSDRPSVTTPMSTSTITLTSENLLTKTDDEPNFNVILMPAYTKETAESIRTLHSFAVPDVMGLQAGWLNNLNTDTLMLALSALISFLAGQVFLTLRDDSIERNLRRYVKRELCSEFALFYDFVIKYFLDKYTPTDDEQSVTGTDIRIMATPRRTHHKTRRSRDKSSLKIGTDTKLVVDVMRICADRPSGRKTEIVDIEDCHLLTSVHWFRHVCSLVHYSKFDEFLSRWHAKSTYVMPHSTFVKNTSVHLSDEEDEIQ